MSTKTLAERLSTVRERDIEKTVCDYARSLKFLVYKFTSPNRRSVPDRIFINPDGLVFFIEFKAPGKLPTESQMREMHRLGQQGCHVYVCDNVEQGKALVNFISDSERVVAEARNAAAEFSALVSNPSGSASH